MAILTEIRKAYQELWANRLKPPSVLRIHPKALYELMEECSRGELGFRAPDEITLNGLRVEQSVDVPRFIVQ